MRINHILLLLVFLVVASSCNKDPEEVKDYNMLKVNSGSISGFSYTYSPNMGYWAVVSATTKYVHLVFGDTDNTTVNGKDIMSILFYHEGSDVIAFPSAQGQHVSIGITVDGEELYYMTDYAQLTVMSFSDNRLIGHLSGEFINLNDSESINVSMDIDIEMMQLSGR